MIKDIYTQITSPFIKKNLVKTNWSNHSYIDELLSLEKYINTSPRSFISAVHFFWLKKKYREEFLILCKESSVNRYKKEVESISNGKKGEKNKDNKLIKKKSWLKAGGLE